MKEVIIMSNKEELNIDAISGSEDCEGFNEEEI